GRADAARAALHPAQQDLQPADHRRPRGPRRGPHPRRRRADAGRAARTAADGRLRPLRLPPPVPAPARRPRRGGAMSDDTFRPTDEQRAVIEHAPDASMLVIAGAGSGKTESIARRIEHLVDHGADPSEILALTFTNKAAAELAKRVRGRLGADTDVLVS